MEFLITIMGALTGAIIVIILCGALHILPARPRPESRHLVAEIIIIWISSNIATFGFNDMHPFLLGMYVGILMQLGSILYRKHAVQKESKK